MKPRVKINLPVIHVPARRTITVRTGLIILGVLVALELLVCGAF